MANGYHQGRRYAFHLHAFWRFRLSQRALASASVGIYPFGSRIHAYFSLLVPINMSMPYV